MSKEGQQVAASHLISLLQPLQMASMVQTLDLSSKRSLLGFMLAPEPGNAAEGYMLQLVSEVPRVTLKTLAVTVLRSLQHYHVDPAEGPGVSPRSKQTLEDMEESRISQTVQPVTDKMTRQQSSPSSGTHTKLQDINASKAQRPAPTVDATPSDEERTEVTEVSLDEEDIKLGLYEEQHPPPSGTSKSPGVNVAHTETSEGLQPSKGSDVSFLSGRYEGLEPLSGSRFGCAVSDVMEEMDESEREDVFTTSLEVLSRRSVAELLFRSGWKVVDTLAMASAPLEERPRLQAANLQLAMEGESTVCVWGRHE